MSFSSIFTSSFSSRTECCIVSKASLKSRNKHILNLTLSRWLRILSKNVMTAMFVEPITKDKLVVEEQFVFGQVIGARVIGYLLNYFTNK